MASYGCSLKPVVWVHLGTAKLGDLETKWTVSLVILYHLMGISSETFLGSTPIRGEGETVFLDVGSRRKVWTEGAAAAAEGFVSLH